MKLADIERRQRMENIKFEAAKKIRVLLDEAKKEYDKAAKEAGADGWDESETEAAVLGLVSDD